MKALNYILIATVAILIAYMCSRKPQTVQVERTTYDTVTVVKTDTIIVEKPYPVHHYVRIEEPTRINSDSIRGASSYQDTTFIDEDFYLYYNASINGRLNYIDLGFYDNRPDSIQVRTVSNTITKTKFVSPRGFYAGGGLSSLGGVSLGGLYMWDKNAILTGYDFKTKSIQVGYYRKLF